MRKDKSVLKTIEMINAQYGKELPRSVEFESNIIGGLINTNSNINTATAILKVKSFYSEPHRVVYETILELHGRKEPFDLASLTNRLKSTNRLDTIGGIGELMKMAKNIVFEPQMVHYCRIVEQNRIARELIFLSSESMSEAYDTSNDIHDTILALQEKLNQLMLLPFDALKKPPEMMKELRERIKYNLESDGHLSGLPYGIRPLDDFTSGIQTTDLTIIAGEPSMGKTSLAVTMANNLTREQHKASVISLEMSSLQLFSRITSQETGISSKAILNHKLHPKAIAIIESVEEEISNRQLFIDPECSSELSSILATIRYMAEKLGVKVFFIDYIQLITISESKANREGQLATIARSLKNLAKELDVAIIALSQMNREKNKTELPSMSRLRGSGQLEEAADNIIFVHRPEYHRDDFMPDGTTPSKDKALLIIAKGRNIGTTEMTLHFEKTTGLFSETKVEYDFGEYNPDKYHEPDRPF